MLPVSIVPVTEYVTQEVVRFKSEGVFSKVRSLARVGLASSLYVATTSDVTESDVLDHAIIPARTSPKRTLDTLALKLKVTSFPIKPVQLAASII